MEKELPFNLALQPFCVKYDVSSHNNYSTDSSRLFPSPGESRGWLCTLYLHEQQNQKNVDLTAYPPSGIIKVQRHDSFDKSYSVQRSMAFLLPDTWSNWSPTKWCGTVADLDLAFECPRHQGVDIRSKIWSVFFKDFLNFESALEMSAFWWLKAFDNNSFCLMSKENSLNMQQYQAIWKEIVYMPLS